MLAEKLQEAAGNGADATLYVDDVFSTWLYTGNGSTQTITNGIDLAGKGGLVWIKSRDAAFRHYLFDTARGMANDLSTNNTDAQGGGGLASATSTGFSFSGATNGNQSGTTFASWTFRKAAKFFDVQTVSHTNGTANTIDLSTLATVGMVIAKNTTTTGDWDVWHRSLTAGNNLQLNLTNAQSTTNAWLSVSGTTATLAASAPTGTYVIYAYAHDTSSTGIIQCGSYTGNGGTPVSVQLGWEPQYLMIKHAANGLIGSGASDWVILDTMRGISSTAGARDPILYPNTSGAEDSLGWLDAANVTATGFTLTGSSAYLTNESGVTYIYMAIRRPNKPPTSGTQVFSLNARTGTGANATVTGGQTDDAVLIKNRGSAVGDLFASRLTGTGYLETSSTAAEVAAGTTILQANPWDVMDGVKVGTTSTITNASANTFINYLFKRAPGFFDVVCYTGTGSATTQAHNLTVVPELMIVKERSAVNNWWVYDAIDGNTKYSVLNSTAIPVTSSTAWNNTTPTSSVFSIGTGANVNASTQTYVAYLFATLAGISKVGSYTGNGTTQTINCGFTGGARFVLIKRTDSTGDWYVFDTARGMTTLTDPYLLLNSTAAEVATLGAVTSVTTGFAVNAAIVAAINTNAASYIYLSIA